MKKLFVSLLMLMSVVSFANTPDPGDKVNAQIKAALAKGIRRRTVCSMAVIERPPAVSRQVHL